MKQDKIVWVGRYQDDIENQHFWGSICQFGKSFDNNFVHTNYKISFVEFIYEKIKWFVEIDESIVFYFYDPSLIYRLPSTIRCKCVYANSEKIYIWLNNKSIARSWMKSIAKVPPFIVLSNKDIEQKSLKSYFHGCDLFVAQKMNSMGGEGTYLIDGEANIQLDNALYIISPYYKMLFLLM